MCQLLGMNCNTPTDIVFSFSGFATRASEHADGFGIAFFEGKGLRHFVDHLSAEASPVADLVKRYPIQSKQVIAHIRKATQGRVALEPHLPECGLYLRGRGCSPRKPSILQPAPAGRGIPSD